MVRRRHDRDRRTRDQADLDDTELLFNPWGVISKKMKSITGSTPSEMLENAINLAGATAAPELAIGDYLVEHSDDVVDFAKDRWRDVTAPLSHLNGFQIVSPVLVGDGNTPPTQPPPPPPPPINYRLIEAKAWLAKTNEAKDKARAAYDETVTAVASKLNDKATTAAKNANTYANDAASAFSNVQKNASSLGNDGQALILAARTSSQLAKAFATRSNTEIQKLNITPPTDDNEEEKESGGQTEEETGGEETGEQTGSEETGEQTEEKTEEQTGNEETGEQTGGQTGNENTGGEIEDESVSITNDDTSFNIFQDHSSQGAQSGISIPFTETLGLSAYPENSILDDLTAEINTQAVTSNIAIDNSNLSKPINA